MRGTRLRSTGKSVISILCVVSFLGMTMESVSPAVAADIWQTWPRKSAEPDTVQRPAPEASGTATGWETWPRRKSEPETEQKPAADASGADNTAETLLKTMAKPIVVPGPAADANGAAKTGDAAEKKTARGRSYRTIGWIALGIAAVVGVAIAVSGGADQGQAVPNPGHH